MKYKNLSSHHKEKFNEAYVRVLQINVELSGMILQRLQANQFAEDLEKRYDKAEKLLNKMQDIINQ